MFITERQILKGIQNLLQFPYPTICKHSVCCDLLSMLEKNGSVISKELTDAIVQADNCSAIKILEDILKRTTNE